MNSIDEIEVAIRDLPKEEFWKLADWFDELRAKAWDRQMEGDASKGNLDFLFDEAVQERESGLLRDWPKVS